MHAHTKIRKTTPRICELISTMVAFLLFGFAILLRTCLSFTPSASHVVVTTTRRTSPLRRRRLALSSTVDYLETVREGIVEAGFEDAWNEATKILSDTAQIDLEQAEECLAKAWSWKTWAICKSPIARKYIKPIEPNVSTIRGSLDWLRTGPLSLSAETLRAGVVDFPEAYLRSPETNYDKALQAAPKEYRDPSDFKALLLEYPTALQRTYNCVDDGCNSECGNCWVQFANSR